MTCAICKNQNIIADYGLWICDECGCVVSKNMDTSIVGYNNRCMIRKQYCRGDRLRRLLRNIQGSTAVKSDFIYEINSKLNDKSVENVLKYLKKHKRFLIPKLASICRNLQLCVYNISDSELNDIFEMFLKVDRVQIPSFSYLVPYSIYFYDLAIFNRVKPFLKPISKLLHTKYDSIFIAWLMNSEFERFIPIIGFNKLFP